METQKAKCCVRGCDSRDTHEQFLKGTDAQGRTARFFVRLCRNCKDKVLAEKIDYSYYRVGTLIFVEEIRRTES